MPYGPTLSRDIQLPSSRVIVDEEQRMGWLHQPRWRDVFGDGEGGERAATVLNEMVTSETPWPEPCVLEVDEFHQYGRYWSARNQFDPTAGRQYADAIEHLSNTGHLVPHPLDVGELQNTYLDRYACASSAARGLEPNTQRSLLPGDPPPTHRQFNQGVFASSFSWGRHRFVVGCPTKCYDGRDLISVPSLSVLACTSADAVSVVVPVVAGSIVPTQTILLDLVERALSSLDRGDPSPPIRIPLAVLVATTGGVSRVLFTDGEGTRYVTTIRAWYSTERGPGIGLYPGLYFPNLALHYAGVVLYQTTIR